MPDHSCFDLFVQAAKAVVLISLFLSSWKISGLFGPGAAVLSLVQKGSQIRSPLEQELDLDMAPYADG